MLGNSHAMYGFLIAELIFIYIIVKRLPHLLQEYNRPMLWITGMFGAWSPDLDGLSGVFNHEFLDLHRAFSHSLGFLFVTLFLIGTYLIYMIKHPQLYQKQGQVVVPSNYNPSGQSPMKREWLHIYTFIIMIVGFAILSSETMYFAYFFILIALLGFGLSFIKTKLPLYGLVFFLGALSHHVCDFISCEWNPFGPWFAFDPLWGFFLWCNNITWGFMEYTLFITFEILPHLIVVLLLIRYARKVKIYKRSK